MTTVSEIHWLAGLLEGEGSFYRNGHGVTPVIYLGMSDRDIVERAHRVFGATGRITAQKIRPPSSKYMWRFQVYSDLAASWMMTLYPLMGARRRARIREVLAAWRGSIPHPRRRVVCKRGHAFDRVWGAGGARYCSACDRLRHEVA